MVDKKEYKARPPLEKFAVFLPRKKQESPDAKSLKVPGPVVMEGDMPCHCYLCPCGCYRRGENELWIERREDGRWIHPYCKEVID